jgi:starch phosphorylase
MRALRRFTVHPSLPESLSALTELATNLRWTWHPPTRDLFASMDDELFRRVRDPLRMLTAVPAARLSQLASDQDFLAKVEHARQDLEGYLHQPRWYQQDQAPAAIAYFSMEFGVHEALPNYSGGLGVLAGDHLKAASDLGVPLIGVGPLYRSGYFRQSLSLDGWQVEHYPVIDPAGLPLELLTEADGSPIVVRVSMPDERELSARIWKAKVGRVPLLLLDADIEENEPDLRGTTDRLYGGDADHGIRQRILAGIGGMRAIRRYCELTGHPQPEVFHTNEGHAGFLGLERVRELIQTRGLDFHQALAATRAGTVFTTHTPVLAGLDRFPRELVRRYFGDSRLLPEIDVDEILSLGAEANPGATNSNLDSSNADSSTAENPNVFNMAHMGLRLAQRANGVSALHGAVSRRMFSPLWSDFDEAEVPISSVTNGVHGPTWVARELSALIGGSSGEVFEGVDSVEDSKLWALRRDLREKLVGEVRRRVRNAWLQRGASALELGWTDTVFDPDVLTVGFARRVPTYKRLTLMLRDRDRLRALLLDERRPLQIVIAGKSHPADEGGKALIQQIVRFVDDPQVRHRIVFLPDYDMSMARYLYRGCDIWLNNPTKPLEACGTSGMKSALNGGLNLSIRDGWWDECYDGSNGWAIPTADGVNDPLLRDDLEASALYDLLGQQIAPLFYQRTEADVPAGWLAMVRHTLKSLGPRVQASRMLREYVDGFYRPAAKAVALAERDDYAAARSLTEYQRRIAESWPRIRVLDTEMRADSLDSLHIGAEVEVRARIELAGLKPEDVEVQVVIGKVGDTDDLTDFSQVSMQGTETGLFSATVRLPHAGPLGYTVRVLPRHPLLVTPAELGRVVFA